MVDMWAGNGCSGGGGVSDCLETINTQWMHYCGFEFGICHTKVLMSLMPDKMKAVLSVKLCT